MKYTAWQQENDKIRRIKIDIVPGDLLGEGATAAVFQVRHKKFGEFSAKIYQEPDRFDFDKLAAMIDKPPEHLSSVHDGQQFPQFAWPISPLFNETDQAVGYLMPAATGIFSLINFIDRPLLAAQSGIEKSLATRIHIVRNLSSLLADLHTRDHYIVDFKPLNIHVHKAPGFVMLLDCDSFSICGADGERFPATGPLCPGGHYLPNTQ